MEVLNVFGDLAGGFATALMPFNILMLFVGVLLGLVVGVLPGLGGTSAVAILLDRKSTRLNSSHVAISYAVFCLKKKKKTYARLLVSNMSMLTPLPGTR